jgi:hypothetical protein
MECDSGLDEKGARLASWNTEILLRHLKMIVASRGECETSSDLVDDWALLLSFDACVFDEVIEIVDLPTLTKNPEVSCDDTAIIGSCIREQLFDFVVSIARLYPENSFHNFEHASHVTMVRPLLVVDICRASCQTSCC